MRFPILVRRLAALVATFAMLLAALAPAVTSALAAANEQHVLWTAVCTADGARLVPVPTDADGVPVAPKSRHVDHCPFCAAHGAEAALPPAAITTLPFVAGADPVVPLPVIAPRPHCARTTAQPRAPPAYS